MKQLREEIRRYQPFIEAVVELFHPFVEAAVHDLRSRRLVMIYNNLSKRKIGDVSALHELKVRTEGFPDYFPPYAKENWNGKRLRCTSITIRDKAGEPIGLICFNFDTSVFQDLQGRLEAFLQIGKVGESPVDLFGEDRQTQIDGLIREYLQANHLSLDHLDRRQKRELVRHLYAKGVFNYKNAPVFLARTLKISRASVYNYLE